MDDQFLQHLLELISAQASLTEFTVLVKKVGKPLARLSDRVLHAFNTDSFNSQEYFLNQVIPGEAEVGSDLAIRSHLAHVSHETLVVLFTELREVSRA